MNGHAHTSPTQRQPALFVVLCVRTRKTCSCCGISCTCGCGCECQDICVFGDGKADSTITRALPSHCSTVVCFLNYDGVSFLPAARCVATFLPKPLPYRAIFESYHDVTSLPGVCLLLFGESGSPKLYFVDVEEFFSSLNRTIFS